MGVLGSTCDPDVVAALDRVRATLSRVTVGEARLSCTGADPEKDDRLRVLRVQRTQQRRIRTAWNGIFPRRSDR